MTAAQFPPGIDGAAVLRPTRHTAWTLPGEGGTAYRRAITRTSPLLFAVTYLGHYLREQSTGVMSFSVFHLELARAARRWVAPEPARDVWIGPRGSAKTTWLFLILALWALAHGHRRFLLAFSLTAEQARGHLANLRLELDQNDLLLQDFPELRPRRARGARNTADTVVASGATIAARGLGASTLGIRSGADRPDLIVGDDIEPDAADHTPAARDKILSRLTDSILPMGARSTVVQLAGTTTMHGSLIHDAVRHAAGEREAAWITAHGFTPRHFSPILQDEHGRRSLWPQRWTLEELDEMRERFPQGFALNMANRPEQAGARGWFTRDLIRYDATLPVTRRLLYADVATTQGRRSDLTALAQIGVTEDRRRAVVERVAMGHIPGKELLTLMTDWTRQQPRTLREWYVESNQGGEEWRTTILVPRPVGVSLELEHVSTSKRSRIEELLSHYQRAALWHRGPLGDYEEQALAWTPASTRDDGMDAVAGGVRKAHLLPY